MCGSALALTLPYKYLSKFIGQIDDVISYLSLREVAITDNSKSLAPPSCMRSLYNSIRPVLQHKRFIPVSLVVLSIPLLSRQYNTINPFNAIMGGSSSSNEKFPVEKSDQEWRAILSPEQVRCLKMFC